MTRYNSPRTHREFLVDLRTMLPDGCEPVIVTDAGFRGPWFRAVEAQGWHWVGRIRNKIKYYDASMGRWRYTDTLYKEATARVRHIGELSLSPRHGYRFRMYLVRAYKPSGGQPRRGERAKCPHARSYRRLHRAPWMIATSLPHEPGSLASESNSCTPSECGSRTPSGTRSLRVGDWACTMRAATTAGAWRCCS